MDANLAYQEERREELIDGKVVMLAPASSNHNRIAENIDFLFRTYLKGKSCVPLGDGYSLYLDENNRVVPDFMVLCDRSKIKEKGIYGAPDLVVEVLSRSTAKNDKWYKKNLYEASGVPEYWIVDVSHKSIEVYLLLNGRYTLDNLYTLYSAEELEDMTVEEKTALVTEFKCHLFDDLVIRLDDIFGDLF